MDVDIYYDWGCEENKIKVKGGDFINAVAIILFIIT